MRSMAPESKTGFTLVEVIITLLVVLASYAALMASLALLLGNIARTEGQISGLSQQRIKQAINTELVNKRLDPLPKSADLFVTYKVDGGGSGKASWWPKWPWHVCSWSWEAFWFGVSGLFWM